MSRIGKLPINIPAGVTVTLNDGIVAVKGPKGELLQKVDTSIKVVVEEKEVLLWLLVLVKDIKKFWSLLV